MEWLENAWEWLKKNLVMLGVVVILIIFVVTAVLKNVHGWNVKWVIIGGFSFLGICILSGLKLK